MKQKSNVIIIKNIPIVGTFQKIKNRLLITKKINDKKFVGSFKFYGSKITMTALEIIHRCVDDMVDE